MGGIFRIRSTLLDTSADTCPIEALHSRRTYDYRIQEAICESGDRDLFPELNIPRSTIRSWIRSWIHRGAPDVITDDEFVAEKIQDWIKTRPTDTYFIEPGSPWQNGHNESFNGVLRDGCLNRWAFLSVREARLIVESWCQEYNEERPHGALNQITSAAYAAGVKQENREAA